LTSAYSTISVVDVAHFMGMSEEDATNCMFNNPLIYIFFSSFIVRVLPYSIMFCGMFKV
jgi:hypothetical protein